MDYELRLLCAFLKVERAVGHLASAQLINPSSVVKRAVNHCPPRPCSSHRCLGHPLTPTPLGGEPEPGLPPCTLHCSPLLGRPGFPEPSSTPARDATQVLANSALCFADVVPCRRSGARPRRRTGVVSRPVSGDADVEQIAATLPT